MSDDALITDEVVEAMFAELLKSNANYAFGSPAKRDKALRAMLIAALAAIRKTHAVVPLEPTHAMLAAGYRAFGEAEQFARLPTIYRAMLAASQEDSDA